MFFKLSTIVAAAVLFAGVANAEQGLAYPRTSPGVGTEPCPGRCPNDTNGRVVALPQNLTNAGIVCCSLIRVSFNGKNINARYTDNSNLTASGVDNSPIVLSDSLYQDLNPGGSGTFGPVAWNVVN